MNVVVLLALSDNQRKRVEAGCPEATYTYLAEYDPERMTPLQPAEAEPALANADVIVGNIAPARLGETPHLKLIQLNSAGYDNYVGVGVPAEVKICCASGAYGQSVSEFMFAMLLAQIKKLPLYLTDQKTHTWTSYGTVSTLKGAHVLVIGTGDIGSHFAALCTSVGAHVDGAHRNNTPVEGFEQTFGMDELLDVLPNYDVVVGFVPGSPETNGLANAEFFAAMKEGAIFINGGRGSLVNQDDLLAALESGHLGAALLDVCTPEPLPAESPLWDAPNLMLTPHASGKFSLEVTVNNICDIAAENIAHLVADEPLRNEVKH